MWIPSLFGKGNMIGTIVTLFLTIINTLLTTQYFYKGGITNLPSMFVAATTWFSLSAIPALHTCWQAQFVIMGCLLALLVLHKIEYQQEATEEAFLASLIICTVAVIPSVLFTGIIMLWGYLIAKRQMTWRVWAASIIAIAIRVVLMAVLHYMGWLEMIWMENIPHLSGLQWLLFCVVYIFSFLSISLPLTRPSLGSGIYYLITIIMFAIANICWNSLIFFYHYPIEQIFT